MDSPRRALIDQFLGYVKELRFPWLLAIMVGLFVVNLLVIDPIPFIDEILLGIAAALLASLRKSRHQDRVIEGKASAQDNGRIIDGEIGKLP
jgi:uncharacterized protein DUF6116